MHDRALVFFTDGETASFAICLFLHCSQLPSLLAVTAGRIARDSQPAAVARAISLMGAPGYCATRFLGVCAASLSLGENVRLGPDRVDGELEALLCRTVQPLAGLVPDLEVILHAMWRTDTPFRDAATA